MVRAQVDVLVLDGHGARDAEGRDDGVEEGGLDQDGQVGVHALRRCAAGSGGADDFPDGMGIDVVSREDEVVGMPLRFQGC